jgi:excisionase family DNA binding protein
MTWSETPSNRVERVTMTVNEAAVRLGISRGSAYAAARRGELPAIRLNRRIVVPRVAFQRWLESAATGSGEPASWEGAPNAVPDAITGRPGREPGRDPLGSHGHAADRHLSGRVVRPPDAARARPEGAPTRARTRGDVPGQGSPDRYPDGDADRVADR